jgi:hypothetical protein
MQMPSVMIVNLFNMKMIFLRGGYPVAGNYDRGQPYKHIIRLEGKVNTQRRRVLAGQL